MKKSDDTFTHTRMHARNLKMHTARHRKLGEPHRRAQQHKRTSTFHYQLKHRPIFCFSISLSHSMHFYQIGWEKGVVATEALFHRDKSASPFKKGHKRIFKQEK